MYWCFGHCNLKATVLFVEYIATNNTYDNIIFMCFTPKTLLTRGQNMMCSLHVKAHLT